MKAMNTIGAMMRLQYPHLSISYEAVGGKVILSCRVCRTNQGLGINLWDGPEAVMNELADLIVQFHEKCGRAGALQERAIDRLKWLIPKMYQPGVQTHVSSKVPFPSGMSTEVRTSTQADK